MLKKCLFICLLTFIGTLPCSFGQEVRIFKVEDFDLHGNVESCLVITDYGKEEYYFGETGRLTKSVTRYSDTDYEMTYYKYANNELTERRVENYRDNTFDSTTSLANFYTVDTTGNRRVTEKIVSYEKKLLEQNIYRYNEEGKLVSIENTDTDGTDENTFVYSEKEGEVTLTQERNGVVLETIQTTTLKSERDSLQKKVLTQKYLDGELNTKTVEVFNSNGKLVSETEGFYDSSTEKWIRQKDLTYTYTENGELANIKSKQRGFTTTIEFIYQFVGTHANNWVKENVTPDNAYKTLRIKYYTILEEVEEPEE